MDQIIPPEEHINKVMTSRTIIVFVMAGLIVIGIGTYGAITLMKKPQAPDVQQPEQKIPSIIDLPPLQEIKPILVQPTQQQATGTPIKTEAASSTAKASPMGSQPKLVIGDTWKWSNRSETYIGEKDGLLMFTLAKSTGEVLQRYRTKDLNVVKDVSVQGVITNVRTPHTGMLSFPLTVGKEWTQQYSSDKVARTATYKVTAYEKLLTAAGQLNVFKIEGVDKRDDLKYGVAVKLWYSPKARAIVQSSGTDQSNKQPVSGWNYDLVSYHVQ